MMSKILHMTLTKQWFDMIASGEKKEEYREIKPYWITRLNKSYDVIKFRNGYKPDSPTMLVEFKGVSRGTGVGEWGGYNEVTYIISLGKVLDVSR